MRISVCEHASIRVSFEVSEREAEAPLRVIVSAHTLQWIERILPTVHHGR